MPVTHEFYADDRLVRSLLDNGDGTGIQYEYDADGEVTSTIELVDLPIPQTPSETLLNYLDQMTDEQAAPVLAVLGWIATLTPGQAAALTATLATIMQGDPQGDL